MRCRYLFILLMLFSAGTPISAHHSFPASYVMNEIVTLDGEVEGWLWRNPHPFIFLNVDDGKGKVVTWHIEFANATAMSLRGLTPESFQKGDRKSVV